MHYINGTNLNNKTLHYKNILFIRPVDNKWEVEYEIYFNPHANPKQLMDKKTFSNFDEALDWSKNYLQDNYINDGESFTFDEYVNYLP